MRSVFASRFALAVVPLGLAVACGETINVVTIDASIPCRIEADAGIDGGADGGVECLEGLFCATGSSCEGPGTCQTEPASCDEMDSPVCGCNNVTYINECFARQAGLNVQSSGRCPAPQGGCLVGIMGAGARPCPSGSACVFIADGVDLSFFSALIGCPTPSPGFAAGLCWGVPAACSPSGRTSFREICSSGMSCVSECQAIKAGGYYDSPTTACQ